MSHSTQNPFPHTCELPSTLLDSNATILLEGVVRHIGRRPPSLVSPLKCGQMRAIPSMALATSHAIVCDLMITIAISTGPHRPYLGLCDRCHVGHFDAPLHAH